MITYPPAPCAIGEPPAAVGESAIAVISSQSSEPAISFPTVKFSSVCAQEVSHWIWRGEGGGRCVGNRGLRIIK